MDSTDKKKIEEIEIETPIVNDESVPSPADLNSENCAVLIATKLGGLG